MIPQWAKFSVGSSTQRICTALTVVMGMGSSFLFTDDSMINVVVSTIYAKDAAYHKRTFAAQNDMVFAKTGQLRLTTSESI